MKYICCALALLLTLGVCCWAVVQRITALTEEIHLLLQEAAAALRREQSEGAGEAICQANALWLQNIGFWGTVLRHSDVDELTTGLELLHMETDAPAEERLARIAEITTQLRRLSEMEQALYYNFL